MEKTPGGRVVLRVYTALVILIGNVLFRAGSFSLAWEMIRAMFTGWHFTAQATLTLQTLCTPLALALLALGLILCLAVPAGAKERLSGSRWAQPASYVLCLGLFALCVMRMAQSGFAPFIYLQF